MQFLDRLPSASWQPNMEWIERDGRIWDRAGVWRNENITPSGPSAIEPDQLRELARCGVAAVHEAQGQTGLLPNRLRALQSGCAIAGPAVTLQVPPGDNLTVHAAVESCHEGDVLVVAPTLPTTDGYVGALLATALQVRGVRGLIIDAGVRDAAELVEMRFPVWCRSISARGTTKTALGSIGLPIMIGSQCIAPGDVVVADDDGVVAVPRATVPQIASAARQRLKCEQTLRRRLKAGELPIDVFELRSELAACAPPGDGGQR